jgi:NAD(P)-dependent dehydrogenase (short-subunit alcohol dehydrogenase family)
VLSPATTTELSPRRKSVVLAICCASMVVVVMDISIVNVALPAIGRDFRAAESGLQWTADAYSLVLAGFLVRVIESLQDLVPATGMIGAMSSGQGSISNNDTGMREVYRGSKAALNMFMRSFAARQPEPARAMVLMAPGWVRTDLGGPGAPLSIEESVPSLVNVMLSRQETPGLHFLDRFGRTVPW